MIQLKVYLYNSAENGYRGEDFTEYVMQGVENVEDLSQEMDTSQLCFLGITRKDAFLPGTKFIIDITENNNIVETLHRVVENDFVSRPILEDSTYFKHEISLIEPSIIAQKRIVDNIACTYKLKDVNLDTQITFDLTTPSSFGIQSGAWTPERNFGTVSGTFTLTTYFGKYFRCSRDAQLRKSNYLLPTNGANKYYHNIEDFKITKNGVDKYKACFRLPIFDIMWGRFGYNYFVNLGKASIYYKVEEYNLDDSPSMEYLDTDNNPTNIVTDGLSISGDNLNANGYNANLFNVAGSPYYGAEQNCVFERYNTSSTASQLLQFTENGATYSDFTDIFEIKPDKKYMLRAAIRVIKNYVRNETADPFTEQPIPSNILEYYYQYENIVGIDEEIRTADLDIHSYNCNISYQTYEHATIQEVLASGTNYSALMLLQKAVMNSCVMPKMDGAYAGNLNYVENSEMAYNVPFYIDDEFVNELSQTSVIENFYNQKNLWEILLEIGYYIHAIPELKFGENDKFMITFNRLGETEVNEKNNTPISISNFRGIDDYIAQTNSYVSNMVQLGGYIDEWVVPKNTDDNFLTYNDTAEIIVSKPIIELLGLQIKCNTNNYEDLGIYENDITDLITTPNDNPKLNALNAVYEENVYKLLSIQYNEYPNKGTSLYYKLRDNKIIGGNYQLPQANTNIYTDYSIKKFIYIAFNGTYPTDISPIPSSGYWTKIKVNDFSFRVIYRTQDAVRQTHTRPDIRKYLLSSSFDAYPQYKQFNNQQDIIVDSEKYGANMYGALIRTGNLNYRLQEWCEHNADLKKKGQLYKINNELYYVAKSTNIFFVDHIESVVEFSKDYNQLSKVIGIPSEPRFYEISEQSMIKREVSIDDFLLITTNAEKLSGADAYLKDTSHLSKLIVGSDTEVDFAKYAVTTFKGDKDMGIYVSTYGQSTLYKDIILPINAFSSGNTLTYEWDTVDNFSAGDAVVDTGSTSHDEGHSGDWATANNAYTSIQAVKYTDMYGKATLMDFYILEDLPSGGLDFDKIKAMPNSPFYTKQSGVGTYIGDNSIKRLATNVNIKDDDYTGRGLVLLKDCREQISINYNLQAIADSDTFVFSPFFYVPKENNYRQPIKLKLALLNTEVNKLSNGYIDTDTIIVENNVPKIFTFNITANTTRDAFGKTVEDYFYIDIESLLENETFDGVKAIALIYEYNAADPSPKIKFSLARNLPSDFTVMKKRANWYFGTPDKTKLFTQKQ